MKDIELLKEYLRLLTEDDYGGFDITSSNADSPYGANFGSGKDLYNVFVKPFTDVIDTTVGKTKELSQRAQTLAKVTFEAIVTSIIPTLKDDYEKIFADEAAQLQKLKSQYGEVYDATWAAFKENDIVAAAFLYDPAAMITTKIAQQAPIQTVKLINVLTGGKLDGFLKRLVDRLKLGNKGSSNRSQGPGLPESYVKTLSENIDIGEILTQDKVFELINDNSTVSRMKSSTRAIVNKKLTTIIQRATVISSAKSVSDLEQKLGIKLKGSDKLNQIQDQTEKTKLEQMILKVTKKSLIEFYVKGLQKLVTDALKAGVPQRHAYIVAVKKTLSKLKTL